MSGAYRAGAACFACVLTLGSLAGCGAPNHPAVSSRTLPDAGRPLTPPPNQTRSHPPSKSADQPTTPRFVVVPEIHELHAGDDGVQFVAWEIDPQSGKRLRDITSNVAWRVQPEGLIAVEPGGYLSPIQAGEATLFASADGQTVEKKLRIAPANQSWWSFRDQIVPILTRQGCNAGGCHGKADGQNGFHLSLFGYDPAGDHERLTRGEAGRRLSLLRPESSLLLLKATGQLPHGGGPRLVSGSSEWAVLRAWIAAGAPWHLGADRGAVVKLEVEPRNQLVNAPGDVQLRAVAHYEDGGTRDVTRWAVYHSNDDRLVDVNARGRATVKAPGETDVIVRYLSHIAPSRLALPRPGHKVDHGHRDLSHPIDVHIFRRLSELNVPASPPARDAVFLRRLSLDLTGQIPEPDEARAFEADATPDKRLRKIDELMTRKDFVDFWLLKFGDLLQITQARFPNSAGAYQRWLESRWKEHAPWDAMVRELLTALGDPQDFREGGPVNYAIDGADPGVQAEQTARRFLGVRLRCAQCHDHPFDVWTQDDYYGMAAFFAKLSRGGMNDGAMTMRPRVTINPAGTVLHARTKQPADTRLLNGKRVQVPPNDDPRGALADWITRPDNPYFSRAFVNWTWAQFFGRGIVDPPDDMSAANPPVHPELLDELARRFAQEKFDIRWLIRTIASSQTYAASAEPVPGNEHDTRLFSHHIPRPLTAHQMADALARATQVPNVFPNRGLRSQVKAIEVFDPATPSTILDTFGRCPRTETCSTIGIPALSLRQSLLVIGGSVIDEKVSHLNGYLAHLLELEPSPAEIVEFLYYRSLCRAPNDEESSHWTRVLSESATLREAAEDLFWALLNSREFAFNH